MATQYRIFMDDSGNVDPAATNAPERRYGSVTAVIMPVDYLTEKFDKALPALSEKHFGLDGDGKPCRLHRRVLAGEPPTQGPFAILRDPEKRRAWDADALMMFEKARYTVISACVDKIAWYYYFPNWRGDFYETLVSVILERCFYFLKNRDGKAEVFIENKNKSHDDRVSDAFRTAINRGYEHIHAGNLRKVFATEEIGIIGKRDRIPGCQFADLIAGPAMQHLRVINQAGDPILGDFTRKLTKILDDKKFYREEGKPLDGYGRIWRPRIK